MVKLSGLGGRLYTGETSFNIVGNRRRWYSVSAIFILLSIGALLIQGLHLGIEFKGGSSYTVNKAGTTVEQARAAVAEVDIPGEIIVQKIGDTKVRIQTGALTYSWNLCTRRVRCYPRNCDRILNDPWLFAL